MMRLFQAKMRVSSCIKIVSKFPSRDIYGDSRTQASSIPARRSRADVTQSFTVKRHDSLSSNVLKQFYIGDFVDSLAEDYTQGHRGIEI